MAWISGAIAAAGSLIGGSMANDSRSDEASSNRQFQMDMSDTAYRRAVADLKAAGINPMMVAKLGGASSPAGNMAQVEDIVTPAISSATAAYRTGTEVEKIRQDTELSRANVDVARSQQALNESQKAKVDSETAINAVMIPKIQADTEQSTSSASFMNAQTELSKRNAEKVYGELDHLALKMGLTEAEIGEVRARTVQALKAGHLLDAQTGSVKQQSVARALNNSLLELELPRAANESEAQGSWWMRNISPYLPDVLKSTAGAARLNNMFKD